MNLCSFTIFCEIFLLISTLLCRSISPGKIPEESSKIHGNAEIGRKDQLGHESDQNHKINWRDLLSNYIDLSDHEGDQTDQIGHKIDPNNQTPDEYASDLTEQYETRTHQINWIDHKIDWRNFLFDETDQIDAVDPYPDQSDRETSLHVAAQLSQNNEKSIDESDQSDQSDQLVEIGHLGPTKIFAPWQYRDKSINRIYTNKMVITDEEIKQKFFRPPPRVKFFFMYF